MEPGREELTEAALRRRRIRILLVFLAIIVGLVYFFRAVLAPFLVAVFIAYLLDPIIERVAPLRLFKRWRIGRGGAIVILYLFFLAAVYVGGIFAVPALGHQMRQARRDLPQARAWAEAKLEAAAEKWGDFVQAEDEEGEAADPAGPPVSDFHLKRGGRVQGEVLARLEEEVVVKVGGHAHTLRRAEIDREVPLGGRVAFDRRLFIRRGIDELVDNLDRVLFFALDFVVALIGTLYKLVLVLMIAAFLVIDRDAIVAFLRTVPPPRYQDTYDRFTVYIDRGLAGVIRGQLTICVVNGILTWVGLQLLGVRYAALLGFIAGVFSLIPIFGTILSTIPIVLIAWGAGSAEKGALALGWILIIHFAEANFLNPKIMGSASQIHPVVVIFALLAGEHAYGLVGALLAVPTASLVQSSFKFYVLDRQTETQAGIGKPDS